MTRLAIAMLLWSSFARSQPRRKVGTVVSGEQWRDEEVALTLQLLEIMGRSDIPVMLGAAFPLVRTRDEALQWQERYGKVSYSGLGRALVARGALCQRWPKARPPPRPRKKMLRISWGGWCASIQAKLPFMRVAPMTNLALAISLDAQFAPLARELVYMGGSLSPQTDAGEFRNNPRHEFNFWFDPEAAHIVLRAPWRKITCTPTDISITTRFSPEMVKRIGASGTPLAKYIVRFYQPGDGNDYMWDELAAAAWLDPSVITKQETRYLSVGIDHGAGYGNAITWPGSDKPKIVGPPVIIQADLDKEKFYGMFVGLMSAPTPGVVH
jgi:purine nucleosidase